MNERVHPAPVAFLLLTSLLLAGCRKEADKAEKRMLELDKKLEQLKNKS